MSALNDEIKEVEAEIESMTESVGTESGLDVDQQQIDDARTKLSGLKDKKAQAQRLIGEAGQSKKDVTDSKAAASTPLVDTEQLEADAEVAAKKEQELRNVLGIDQKPEEATSDVDADTDTQETVDGSDVVPLPTPQPRGKVASWWETFRQKVDDKFFLSAATAISRKDKTAEAF